MDTFNTIDYGLDRTRQELDEAKYAHEYETPEALLYELIDVQIFIHSLMGKVANQLGVEPAAIDQMIETKMAANHTKYDEAFFRNGWDTSQAITVARHWWNLGLHEEDWIRDE